MSGGRSSSSRHVRNSAYVMAARGAELVTGVFTVGLATRYLGPDTFGNYAFIGTTTAVLSPLIALGCARILVRDLAVDGSRTGSLVVSALWLHLALSFVALAATLAVVFGVGLRSPLALAAAAVAVAAQTIMVLRQSLSAVPLAREAMVYEAWQVVAGRLALVALFVAVVAARLSYLHFFTATVVAGAVSLVMAGVISARLTSLQWGLRASEMAYLARESAPVALYNFLGQMPMYVNVFLLQWLGSAEAVAYFQAPQRVFGPVMILPMSLVLAFSPAIARLGADLSRRDELRRHYATALRWMFVLVLPACVAAGVYAPELTSLLFGRRFLPSSVVFGILCWGILPFSLNALVNTLLTAMGKQGVVAWAHVAALGISLAAGLALAVPYGHDGAGLAFLIGVTALYLINHTILARYVQGLPLWSTLWRPALAAGLLSAALIPAKAHLAFPWVALLGLCLYGCLALIFKAVTPRELRGLARLVKGK
ncbi:MAG: flippase [Lentisphaerae bacterium]|nr:flippase [Lentisphaerota bacterium]